MNTSKIVCKGVVVSRLAIIKEKRPNQSIQSILQFKTSEIELAFFKWAAKWIDRIDNPATYVQEGVIKSRGSVVLRLGKLSFKYQADFYSCELAS